MLTPIAPSNNMGYTDYELIEKLKVMLVESLEEEKTVSTEALEAFMNEYRGKNWLWQQACHRCEAAQVLFVRE
ncbi:MAG: hypothetical protein K0U36_04990, partial [Alphaproteobacteria bacterium]|nr:hypothetical protein [Alphaproteobacteria bacterium]